MEDTTPAITGNGHPPGEEVTLPDATPAVAGLRRDMEALQRERDHYQAKIDRIMPTLKRYEKAITILEGEQLGPGGRPPTKKEPGRWAGKRPDGSKSIGDERLEQLKAAILQWSEDHEADEFRQVDIRSVVDFNSSTTAVGFEKLRQEGFLRFARQSGNNKYFRLTRETLKAT
jgi:hypothetical protein